MKRKLRATVQTVGLFAHQPGSQAPTAPGWQQTSLPPPKLGESSLSQPLPSAEQRQAPSAGLLQKADPRLVPREPAPALHVAWGSPVGTASPLTSQGFSAFQGGGRSATLENKPPSPVTKPLSGADRTEQGQGGRGPGSVQKGRHFTGTFLHHFLPTHP